MEMAQQKRHIEEIKGKYISTPEFVLDSFSGTIDKLLKAFPRRGHFLMEFVQNADDAKSTTVRIEIDHNIIRILNDGKPFDAKDVESICKAGRSSKTREAYMGYLGVGFKSVFLVSECPRIYSGGYRFKFDKSAWLNARNVPWQIIPEWIPREISNEGEGATNYTTAFLLPIGEKLDERLRQKIRDETRPENLSGRVLIFLHNLTEIDIENHVDGLKRKLVKSANLSHSKDYEIYELQEYAADVLSHQHQWLVFRSGCQVPDNVRADSLTQDWERGEVTNREVLVAFRLDDVDNLEEEERGTAHIGVFSFLPLKEVPSGLKFLIQADFLTAPGREVIQYDALWNEWLAKEILQLITSRCIPVFLKHGKWRLNFSQVLYPGEGGHPLFDDHIKKPLVEYLKNSPVLVCEDGSPVTAVHAISIAGDVRDLLTDDDLRALYPGKKPLHPDCLPATELRQMLAEGPTFSAAQGTSSAMDELLRLRAQAGDLRWFQKFYGKIAAYEEFTLKRSRLRNESIILTSDLELATAAEVWVKPPEVSLPVEVKGHFQVVHEDLLQDQRTQDFLAKIGVKTLSEDDVRTILRKKEIPQMGSSWPSLSDAQRIEKVKVLKELWAKGQVQPKDLGFVTLKTKSGKWLPPQEVLLPADYAPAHNIDHLVQKDLLDIPVEFLGTEFIQGVSKVDLSSWSSFFRALGVDAKLDSEKKSIVQRIGVKTALRFESGKGRNATELPESVKPGYDITSAGPTGERCIEVKGSSDTSPRIPLTGKEFQVLQNSGDKYFVYVIEDALRNPRLYAIRGRSLIQSSFSLITVDAKQWKGLTEEEYQP